MNQNKETIHYYTIKTNKGIEYVAEISELKGCIGSGKTQEEALQELLENRDIYLDTLLKLHEKKNMTEKADDYFHRLFHQYSYLQNRQKQNAFLIAEKKDKYHK